MPVFRIHDKSRGVIEIVKAKSVGQITSTWGPGVEEHLSLESIPYEFDDIQPEMASWTGLISQEMANDTNFECYLGTIGKEQFLLVLWPGQKAAIHTWHDLEGEVLRDVEGPNQAIEAAIESWEKAKLKSRPAGGPS